MKNKNPYQKKKSDYKKMSYLKIHKSYLNLEKKKLIFMVKYNQLWLLVEIFNHILENLIKNFKDNKNYYIMLNIKFN